MPKRILSVSHYYVTENRGGGEVMLHHILRAFIEQGAEVDAVVTDSRGDLEMYEGVRLYKGRKYLDIIGKKYDLVITHFQEANLAIPKAQALGIPVVYIVHNNMTPTIQTLEKFRPDFVVFNTEWLRNFYKYEEPSVVLHPPVYAERHATEPGEHITLINMIPSKGAYMFYHLAQRFPRQRFLGVKGGYYKNQQVILRRPNVTIIENTDDMPGDVWSQTKVLLMPSVYESYGMAGVEALASGIPVIANPTPGLKESLGDAGIFPPNTSIGEWRKVLMWLLIPENYAAAQQRALARSSQINPDVELQAFMKEVYKLL